MNESTVTSFSPLFLVSLLKRLDNSTASSRSGPNPYTLLMKSCNGMEKERKSLAFAKISNDYEKQRIKLISCDIPHAWLATSSSRDIILRRAVSSSPNNALKQLSNNCQHRFSSEKIAAVFVPILAASLKYPTFYFYFPTVELKTSIYFLSRPFFYY